MRVHGTPRAPSAFAPPIRGAITTAHRRQRPLLILVLGVALATVVTTTILESVVDGLRFTLVDEVIAIGAAVLFILIQRSRLELKHELRRARARSVEAGDSERRRIQRDLHDTAQQRLISVRIRMEEVATRLPDSPERVVVEGLGGDLDAALAEIRSVAQGADPSPLLRLGLPRSLHALAARMPVPVALDVARAGRYDARIERNVYLCIAEALQNVVKHAGAAAAVRVHVDDLRDRLLFEVEDTGVGFDAASTRRGDGLANIADRVSMLRGHLTVDSRPGEGTRIRGIVPIGPQAPQAPRRPQPGTWMTSRGPDRRQPVDSRS